MLRALLRRFNKSDTKNKISQKNEPRVVVCLKCDYVNSAELCVEDYFKMHNEQCYCPNSFVITESKRWKNCVNSSELYALIL
jgi:hypothetical protein